MNYIKSCFLLAFLFINSTLFSQVAYSHFFTQDHEGVIINNRNEKVEYEFKFISADSLAFIGEGNTVSKSNYTLSIKDKESEIKFDFRFRNLLVSLYLECEVQYKDGSKSTVTGIYNKVQRWIKIKSFVPKKYRINNNSTWGRKNDITSFEQILDFFVEKININLETSECCAGI